MSGSILYQAPGWFLGRIPNVVVCRMAPDRIDDESFDEYIAALADEIDATSVGDSRAVLYDVPNAAAMSSRRRKRIAVVLATRRSRLREINTGYVMCTQSRFVRGVMTAINWLAPPPYPFFTAPDVASGFALLAESDPRIVPDEATEAYRALQRGAAEAPRATGTG